jgi:hypothetical protein
MSGGGGGGEALNVRAFKISMAPRKNFLFNHRRPPALSALLT